MEALWAMQTNLGLIIQANFFFVSIYYQSICSSSFTILIIIYIRFSDNVNDHNGFEDFFPIKRGDQTFKNLVRGKFKNLAQINLTKIKKLKITFKIFLSM